MQCKDETLEDSVNVWDDLSWTKWMLKLQQDLAKYSSINFKVNVLISSGKTEFICISINSPLQFDLICWVCLDFNLHCRVFQKDGKTSKCNKNIILYQINADDTPKKMGISINITTLQIAFSRHWTKRNNVPKAHIAHLTLHIIFLLAHFFTLLTKSS